MFNRAVCFVKIKPTLSQVVTVLKENRISSGLSSLGSVLYRRTSTICSVVTGEKDVEGYDLGLINNSLVNEFKYKCLKGITDQGLIASKKRTINSIIRAMKGLHRMSIYDGYNMEFVDCENQSFIVD